MISKSSDRQMALWSGSRSGWISAALLVSFFIAPVLADDLDQQISQDDAAVETRLKETVEYLASDELQGRGAGSEGIDKAADYIAKRMGKIGLKTDVFKGSPYQSFSAAVMKNEDESHFYRLNVFSYFGNTVYFLFAKIGDLSPDNEPSKSPGKAVEGLVKIKNVVAMLEAQGPLAEETIVIGAHYDHLGVRKTRDGKEVIYNGANDNASGVAVMLETAEILAHRDKKLPRRIVFVAFSGEESGLLGSFHYVNHPAVPLNKTIAMINLDVVGRMEGDMVVTVGTSTSLMLAKTTEKIVKQRELSLVELPGVLAGSDHAPFYSCQIPVVFFLSQGGMGDMHQPTDDADKLNYPGMRKIAQVAADLAVELAEADKRPEFCEEGVISVLFRNLLRLWGSFSDN